MRMKEKLRVSAHQEHELQAIIANPESPKAHVERARTVLMAAQGAGTMAIATYVGRSKSFVRHSQALFLEEGVLGLTRKKVISSSTQFRAARYSRVMELSNSPPPEGRRWTIRLVSELLGVPPSTVFLAWRHNSYSPLKRDGESGCKEPKKQVRPFQPQRD